MILILLQYPTPLLALLIAFNLGELKFLILLSFLLVDFTGSTNLFNLLVTFKRSS